MKKMRFFYLFLLFAGLIVNAQVGIGTTTPNASSILDIVSTNKGLLIPRMTTAQRTAIAAPAAGLQVYDTTTNTLWYRNATTWVNSGNAGTNLYNTNGTLNANRLVTQGAFSLDFSGANIVDGFAVDGTTFSVDALNNRIGIGTAAPTRTLDVVGNARISTLANVVGDVVTADATGNLSRRTAAQLVGDGGGVLTASNGLTKTGTNVTLGGMLTAATTVALGANALNLTSTGGDFSVGTNTLVVDASANSVGVGTATPQASAILDLTSTNKALILPRVASVTSITTPTNGMMVYDISQSCTRWYENGAWAECVVPLPNATVTGLDCAGVVKTGAQMTEGVPVGAQTARYSFSGGAFGKYNAQAIPSTGVTGLTASLPSGVVSDPTGTITYSITGTPNLPYGTANFAINFAGRSCTLSYEVDPATVPVAGRQWMNRNLGSVRQTGAISATDHLGYGSLYQWGRSEDGHQLITWTAPTTGTPINGTTTVKSDAPINPLFITAGAGEYEWTTNNQNNNGWVANDPCPNRFRVPSTSEVIDMKNAIGITSASNIYEPIMKLTLPGYRDGESGIIVQSGLEGVYTSNARYVNTIFPISYNHGALIVTAGSADVPTNPFDPSPQRYNATGSTIRCIKN